MTFPSSASEVGNLFRLHCDGTEQNQKLALWEAHWTLCKDKDKVGTEGLSLSKGNNAAPVCVCARESMCAQESVYKAHYASWGHTNTKFSSTFYFIVL